MAPPASVGGLSPLAQTWGQGVLPSQLGGHTNSGNIFSTRAAEGPGRGLTKALDGSALIYSYLSLPALACGRTLGGMSETRCVSKALKLSFLLHCSVVAERPTSEKRYAVVATHENGGLELSEDSQSQATSSDMKQITERVLVNPDSGRSGNREGEFVESEAPSTEVKSGGASENVEKNGSISKTFVLPSDVGVGAKIPQADSKGGMRWNMLLSTEALRMRISTELLVSRMRTFCAGKGGSKSKTA